MPRVAAVVHDDHPAGSFGEFEIIREIGRGGMGIVYEAQQTSLNRQVALKVLSVGWGFSKQAVIRFQRKAQAAARLHHTNIVPIYTTGMQNQIPYYAMELVRGPSLNQVLKQLRNDSSSTDPSESNSGLSGSQEKSTPAEAGLEAVDGASRSPGTGNDSASRASTVVECHTESLQSSFGLGSGADYFDKIARFVAEVADALEHAHREGVIHRDIKPSNLLLSPDGRVSINDFGLAQMLDHPGVTITGELMGSPRYMSPEQISPDLGPLDHRTDIYSLGVTLYELITLRPAFDGHQRAASGASDSSGTEGASSTQSPDPCGLGNHLSQGHGKGSGTTVPTGRHPGERSAPIRRSSHNYCEADWRPGAHRTLVPAKPCLGGAVHDAGDYHSR